MTLIMSKLKEVYIDLLGPHNLPSYLESIYVAILIYKQIRKTKILYLNAKDN